MTVPTYGLPSPFSSQGTQIQGRAAHGLGLEPELAWLGEQMSEAGSEGGKPRGSPEAVCLESLTVSHTFGGNRNCEEVPGSHNPQNMQL